MSVTVALNVNVLPATNVCILGLRTTLVESSMLIDICAVPELGA